MKKELNIYELGDLLHKLGNKYLLSILIKKNLSGGWLTISGEAKIINKPCLNGGCHSKPINILEIKVTNNGVDGSLIKLTGDKNKKFNVDLSPTKYKEVNLNSISLNTIKNNEEETKLRIDDDIIMTIKGSLKEVEKIL